MAAWFRWIAVGGIALVAGAAVALQHQKVGLLRDQAELAREQVRERRQLEAENRALRERQPSAEKIATVGRNRVEAERLRRDLPALRERLDRLLSRTPVNDGPQPPLAAGAARNVGRATPGATIETALWAVTEGDLDALAETLLLPPAARARAEALLAGLPVESRARYGSPEKLVALLAAKDMPLDGIQVLGLAHHGEDEVRLRVRLQDERRAPRVANFSLQNLADGWRLVVPEKAVIRYVEMVQGQTGK